MNAIGVIGPYKYEGMWVFDDPAVGLSREPFVAGIDTMIDRLVASIPGAERGFRLLFSATPFPGHTVKLEWRRAERSEEHTSELQSQSNLVCRLLLEKNKPT